MRAKGAMFTVLSAILSGVTPAFAKLIYAEGVNTVTLVFFRNLFAIVPLLLICLWQRCSFRMNGRQAAQLLLSGVFGQTLTLLMLYASYQYIPIATATTLHFMYPIFITLICALVFRERMTWFRLAALGAATLGVGCFVDIDGGSDMGGMSLALLSALTFAYYMVSVEKSGLNRLHPFVITFYFAIVISVAIFLYGMARGELQLSFAPQIYGKMLLFSLFTSVAALGLLQLGIRLLGAADAAILCMFEPLTSFIAGVLLLNEELSLLKAAGSVLILGAVLFMILMNRASLRKERVRNEKDQI